MRHSWAKHQCENGDPTSALIQYQEESFNELALLMATNPRIDQDTLTMDLNRNQAHRIVPDDLKQSGEKGSGSV